MRITVDGTTYEFDLAGRLPVQEAIPVEEFVGVSIERLGRILAEADEAAPGLRLRCIVALVWIAKRRAGEQVAIDAVDFDLNTFTIEDEPDPTDAVAGAVP